MLVVAFLYALTLRNKIALRHIPSPPSWPLIGHVPTVIFGKPWEAFTKWSHKYGKIYTMYAIAVPKRRRRLPTLMLCGRVLARAGMRSLSPSSSSLMWKL